MYIYHIKQLIIYFTMLLDPFELTALRNKEYTIAQMKCKKDIIPTTKNNIFIILDASGSMNFQLNDNGIDIKTKIQTAKQTLAYTQVYHKANLIKFYKELLIKGYSKLNKKIKKSLRIMKLERKHRNY